MRRRDGPHLPHERHDHRSAHSRRRSRRAQGACGFAGDAGRRSRNGPCGEVSRRRRGRDRRAPPAARAALGSDGARGSDRCPAQQPPRGDRLRARRREGVGVSVRFTTLPSGLRVVTDAAAHLRTASLGVFVEAGSRYERASEHGLSHFIEHMAFKGTRRRNAREIAETIENVGGDLNAETGVERTSYFARVLASDADLVLDVIGDLLTESAFAPEELEREKNVVVQEIGAVEDTPDDLVFDLLTATAWPDQPIGRPILGTREGVGAFDRAAIDLYLGRRYNAGATVVAAAGAVEHDHILDLVQSRLGTLSQTPAPDEARAAYRGGEIKVKRRLEQTHVVVGFEGRGSSAPENDAAQIFATAAGGGMSSRLFQEVREKRGLAYSIYGFHWDFIDTGLFGFYAASAHRDVAEVVAASLDCLGSRTRARG